MKINNVTIRSLYTARWLFLLLAVLFIVFQFLTGPKTTAHLGSWKLMLGVAAAIVGYIVGKALHPKMSLSALLESDKEDEFPDAIKLLAVCFYRGVIMLGFIVGVLLGV